MTGKYDNQIVSLFQEAKGSRLIARELGLSNGYVGKRMKALGLHSGRSNQHSPNSGTLPFDFSHKNERLPAAAEQYLKYLCNLAGFDHAEPSVPKPYDLLVDFGDGWQKVQVKSSTSAAFRIDRRRIAVEESVPKYRRIPYTTEEIDYIFFYRIDERCWLVPFDVISSLRSATPHAIFPGFEVKMSKPDL